VRLGRGRAGSGTSGGVRVLLLELGLTVAFLNVTAVDEEVRVTVGALLLVGIGDLVPAWAPRM